MQGLKCLLEKLNIPKQFFSDSFKVRQTNGVVTIK